MGTARAGLAAALLFCAGLLAPACTEGSSDDSSSPPKSLLQVTPKAPFNVSGPVGGPFTPPSQVYVVQNIGAGNLVWSVEVPTLEPWIQLSKSGGMLQTGAQDTVTVSIVNGPAGNLVAGVYPVVVEFLNQNNAQDVIGRGINLTITSGAGLEVLPDEEFSSFGPVGGPFVPPSKVYRLRNSTGAPLTWSASSTTALLQVAPAGGTLAPSGQVNVTASVDQAAAGALPLGTYSALIHFVNLTDGSGNTSRGATLGVTTTGAGLASTLSQFGITWTFDQVHDVGQFANGDWWVVGPVRIIDIDPPSKNLGGRTMNGAMLNPTPRRGWTQGYDSAAYGQYAGPGSYDPQLNVALDVSPSQPLDVPVDSSLVCTISLGEAGGRPQLLTAAILTVLDQVPPAGSFRPAYCGNDKSIVFNAAQLDYGLLARLTPVASTPTFAVVERYFERPWIDHVPDFIGRYVHPLRNLPDYGREIADQVGQASLMLHVDFTDAQKERLLVRFVQAGIDLWGVLEDGGVWQAGDGHHSGRKWPIVFAGLVLGDTDMAGVGHDPSVLFMGEDGQTFTVMETSPGVYNQGFGGYGPQHVGLREWGKKHELRPEFDDEDWLADPYRSCCTANAWYGQLLSCLIMGAKPLWNHDVLFDYQDRYLQTSRQLGLAGWQISWSDFPLDMWDAYRSNYP